MPEVPKTGLVEFVPHEKSFAQRFVDSVFAARAGRAAGEIFQEAYSDSGYTPDIVEAQHWAVGILNESSIEPMKHLADLDLVGELFSSAIFPTIQDD